MSKKANPALIGSFVLGALALAVALVFLVSGGSGRWQNREQHILYFEGSVYGLQVGAPVVFRGVKVGLVKEIGIVYKEEEKSYFIPVSIELNPPPVKNMQGSQIEFQQHDYLKTMIDAGLRAQLATQSLLTGMLYIDLDFHPDADLNLRSNSYDPHEIPTIPTTVQKLKQHLENVDFETLISDISAIAHVVREKSESTALDNSLSSLEKSMKHLASLTSRLDAQADPMMKDVRTVLSDVRTTLQTTQVAIQQASDTMGKVGNTLDQDSALLQNLNQAIRETRQAAHALRLLSETLEQQPESLLRGKKQEKP